MGRNLNLSSLSLLGFCFLSLAPNSHAENCDLFETITQKSWPTGPGKRFPRASERSKLGEKLAHDEVIENLSPSKDAKTTEEFAQSFKAKLLDLVGRKTPTPKEQIRSILDSTNLEDLKVFEKNALYRQSPEYAERLKKNIETSEAQIAKFETETGKALPEDSFDKRQLAHFKKVYATLQDPIAKGNAPHVNEVRGNIKEEEFNALMLKIDPSLSAHELQHLFQFQKTLAAAHDLGKTYPSHGVLEAAKKLNGENPETPPNPGQVFLAGRIGMHDLSSAGEILWLGKTLGLDVNTTVLLMRNNMGHNDGSGLADVWWNQYGRSGLGPDHIPDTVFSQILAMTDRGGQATLGDTGGVKKITLQGPNANNWGRELLEKQTMLLNANNTLRQLEAIADNFEKATGTTLRDNPAFKRLVQSQQQSINAFHSIRWDSNNKSGTIAGERFENAQEFFDIIQRVQASQQDPSKYWAKQAEQRALTP